MIVALCNQKGSVGKTTTALNLGAALVEQGNTISLFDLDSSQFDLQQLAQSANLPCQSPTSGSLRDAMSNAQWNLIECPPRADRAMREALSIADVVLVPVVCEFMAIRGLGRMLKSFQEMKGQNSKMKLKVLLTMYSAPFKEARDELVAMEGIDVCKTIIPRMSAIAFAPASGQTVLTFAPKSRGAVAYRNLAKEILTWQEQY